MIDPGLERARPDGGAASTDAVTFAFADPGAGLFGLARAGLSPAPDGGRAGSALAVLFAERRPVAAVARGGTELGADADFAALALPGLRTTVEAPLERWTVDFADDGGHGFALTFEAVGEPAEPDGAVVRAGGMEGYEQLCRVRGTVRAGGREHVVDGLGQRGHTWGEPDWSRIELARTVGAWLEDGSGVTLTAVRPAGAASHADEAVWAALLGLDAVGGAQVAEPRLSTTADGEGRQRRAGLELWLDPDDPHPRRAAGEALCGSTIELGQLRLDCAFFAWHMDGRSGVGRYDVLRRS